MPTLSELRFKQSKQKKNTDPLEDMYIEKSNENQRLKSRINELESLVLKLGGKLLSTRKPLPKSPDDLVYDDETLHGHPQFAKHSQSDDELD